MKFCMTLFLFLISTTCCAQVNFSLAKLCDGSPITKTPEEDYASSIFSNVLRERKITDKFRCLGWTNIGKGDVWYIVLDSTIYGVDIAKKQLTGHWPLSPDLPCDEKFSCNDFWWYDRWSSDELLEKYSSALLNDGMIYGGLSFESSFPRSGNKHLTDSIMGCMHHAPLRYGDIEGNGTRELIIFSAQGYSIDWIVFSETLQKTIFAIKLNIDDVADPKKVPEESIPKYNDKLYQYWMQSGVDAYYPSGMRPALKSYAKLYFGDFNNDGKFDILAWRKMYLSRLVEDKTRGFELKSEMFGHYELQNGEYHLASTNADTIKSWLSAKKLTWSNGYPNQSECPGEEGKLIPEMHDPRLNDPEVFPTTP